MAIKKNNLIDKTAKDIVNLKNPNIINVGEILYSGIGKYILKLEIVLNELEKYSKSTNDFELQYIIEQSKYLTKKDI